MDYSQFNYLTEKIMRDVSTSEDEKELIRILQTHMEEKEKERKQLAYEHTANEINASIDNFLKVSGEHTMRVKIEGDAHKNSYIDIKSAYYNPTQGVLILRTPMPFDFDN